MSDLPRGWASTTLGAVCEVVSGATPKTSVPGNWGGDIPWVTPDDLSKNRSQLVGRGARFLTRSGLESCSARLMPPGTVLYSSRAPIGYAAIAANAVATNQGFKSLIPPQGLSSKYLYWYMSFITPEVRRRASGTTFLEISKAAISEVPLPIPPTAEQERIVAAIEEEFSRIDAGVAELVSARARLDALLRAVERSATLGRLVPQNLDDEPATELLKRVRVLREKAMREAGRVSVPVLAPDTSKLPKLPSTWAWASLDEVADVAGGVTKDQKKQDAPGNVEVPYLRVANVQRGRLDLTHVATIRVPPQQAEALRLIPGDVLFNEGGDRDKLGRGWVWEGQIDNCVHQNHVFRARLYSDELNPRFLSTHGNAFGRSWFERMGKQTTNLASLNRTTLRSFPVPIPPAAEQQRIMDVLAAWTAAIRAAAENVEAQTRRSNLLRSTVLTAAFSGSLVPQDHSDEPAARLLERLAAEQAPSNGHQTARSRRPRTRVTA